MVRMSDGSHSVLVIEAIRCPGIETGCIYVQGTIPGREGHFSFTWKCRYGIPDDTQMDDVAAKVTQMVQQALIANAGVQGVMPLE